MQKISVQNLKHGMTTYNRLSAADGRILLGSNIQLTERYIERIQKMGVFCLSVTNPIIERIGLTYEETLPEEKKTEVTRLLKDSFDDAKKGKLIDVYRSVSALAKMIEETIRKNQIIRMDNIATPGDYVYKHCVNVAVLAAVIASDLGYNATKMHEIVMGALLHDIGIVLMDEDANELEHPQLGFDYARKLRGYSVVSGHIIFQHHEKYDGTGYPRGLQANQIHEYARITAIADAYDTMVAGPKNKEICLPHQAYEGIMAMSGTHLDRELANIFLAKAPLYPIGTFVVLDTGHIGVVTEARPKLQARPTIMILTDSNGELHNEWSEINLIQELTTFITRVLSEEEVIELTNNYETLR
ncbi:HD-GYP domain-containing protein [Dendrosporobacter sp. 1207_IL3150]|uniref:HD-GYP domain-containing protein n=1 Tax=Dendrosporobacter sp. 1207_IL3150 TaxID=3084054 RepID=UPI002FD8ECCD